MPDFKLTPEVKKAMIGLMPFSQDATIDFTPEVFNQDKIPEKARPVFIQRPYKKQEVNEINSTITGQTKLLDPKILEWSRKSVMGWRGIFDLATEKPVDFDADENGNPKKEIWDTIPPIIQTELYTNAMKISGLIFPERRGLNY